MQRLGPISIYTALLLGLLSSMAAQAAPMFARQYGVSCMTCHAAFPRLNAYGEEFAANNFRMPNWKDTTVQTGDDQLALPSQIPMQCAPRPLPRHAAPSVLMWCPVNAHRRMVICRRLI